MNKQSYKVLGIMSGTSKDGIDMAEVELKKINGLWHYQFFRTETYAYSDEWFHNLSQADRLSAEEVEKLDHHYTQYLGNQIRRFIEHNSIENLDAVCSHGHTVWHKPKEGFTFQMGNRPELAQILNQKVVCDFRVQDVKLGGQGAPLVPIGDQLLFAEYAACINLGGFANISMEVEDKRIAFDIAPVNIVLNHLAESLNQFFDDGGKLARNGLVNQPLLKELDALEFYRAKPPKSLGIEWVREYILPLLHHSDADIHALLATYTQHAANQIAKVIKDFKGKVLFTGGGCRNTYLMELVAQQTEAEITVPNTQLIDYKEALVFGLLGVLKLRNEINVLSSVTGASQDHSSGVVFDFKR